MNNFIDLVESSPVKSLLRKVYWAKHVKLTKAEYNSIRLAHPEFFKHPMQVVLPGVLGHLIGKLVFEVTP